ncbi:MAG: hypothetical protein WD004_08300 [Actinomycetota bacterium]
MRIATRLGVTILITCSLALIPSVASAAVTFGLSGGDLTITGDSGNDTADITCSGGNLLINGLAPFPGPTPCSSITTITVNMGAGSDMVLMTSVTATDFSSLTGVDVMMGPGDDILGIGYIGGTLAGNGGNDLFNVPDSTSTILTDTSLNLMGELSSVSGFDYANMQGTSAPDTLDGSGFSGFFNLAAKGGGDTVIGGAGLNILITSAGDDMLVGNGGNDRFEPGTGNDTLDGGPGTDRTSSQFVANVVATDTTIVENGTETDTLTSVEHVQIAVSVLGDATARTQRANLLAFGPTTTLLGGSGADTFRSLGDTPTYEGNGGLDIVKASINGTGTLSDTQLQTSSTDIALLSEIERALLRGAQFDDEIDASAFNGRTVIRGNDGQDLLIGGSKPDRIFGDEKKDTLIGNGGGDYLNGGNAADTCMGGPGNNHLVSC